MSGQVLLDEFCHDSTVDMQPGGTVVARAILIGGASDDGPVEHRDGLGYQVAASVPPVDGPLRVTGDTSGLRVLIADGEVPFGGFLATGSAVLLVLAADLGCQRPLEGPMEIIVPFQQSGAIAREVTPRCWVTSSGHSDVPCLCWEPLGILLSKDRHT